MEELFDDPLVLVCPVDSAWAETFRKLPHTPVASRGLLGFPLVLQESNAGIREVLDARLREAGVLNQVDVGVEVGGWSAILAYLEAGLGVGLLPRSVLARQTRPMLVRTLHTSINPPNRVRLIGRALPGTDQPDLSETAQHFRDALRSAVLTLKDTIAKVGRGDWPGKGKTL